MKPARVWEVWHMGSLVCSAQMGLSESQARNKVENERRRGCHMEARPAPVTAHVGTDDEIDTMANWYLGSVDVDNPQEG